MKKKVEQILKEVETAGELVWKQKPEVYQEIQKITRELSDVLPVIIADVNKYRIEEVTEEYIMQQLRNMVSGLEKRDDVLLGDTLNYGIYNILSIYLQLLEILEEDNQ